MHGRGDGEVGLRRAPAIAVVLLLPALGGCDEISAQLDNALYGGTHIGVQRCIDRNRTESLSLEPIRRLCIAQNEAAIAATPSIRVQFQGPSEPRTRLEKLFTEGAPSARFSVEVSNDSTTYVVTSYRIRVAYARAPAGDDKSKVLSGQWLEPGASEAFDIDDVELGFETPLPQDAKASDFRWWITDVRGVEIVVR